MSKVIDTAGIKAIVEKDPVKAQKIISRVRAAADSDFKIISSEDFYRDIRRPVTSPLYKYIDQLKSKDAVHGNFHEDARILEFNLHNDKMRYRGIKNSQDLLEAVKKSESMNGLVKKIREAKIRESRQKHLRNLVEDQFGGPGFSDDMGGGLPNTSAFPVKTEFAPLIGTPFFKQMYLYDYLLAHSKCFYFKNYSGIAKNIIGNVRNFVIGRGFSVTIDDEKAEAAWDKYLERSNVEVEIRNWTDELTCFGEIFLKKVFTPQGIIHRSIDPSTIWEIVTDPENINDVKYYHQQYSTQYQMYGDKNTPLSKYILQQLPPDQVRHYKVNVTSYEKRGRGDMLAALLYLKYYEDYTQFKLLRVKNEAAFSWDVTVKGDEGDVDNYMTQTADLMNMPPGSENVHNEAIERKPLAPAFSHSGTDDVMKWIVSYICMNHNIPATYLGLLETAGGSTRAGALVSTEPVIRMFDERRTFVERMADDIFRDVMIDSGIDPDTVEHEFNFPEFVNEDRTKKIQDLITCKDEKFFTHKRAAEMAAKEMTVNNYDYEKEQEEIQEEVQSNPLVDMTIDDPAATQLTKGDLNQQNGSKDNRAFDRNAVRQQGKTFG